MFRLFRSTGGLLALCWLILGCVHIPKESVALSEHLTQMIIDARASHMALIDHYMAEKHAALGAMFEEQWIPRFMENGLRDTGLMDSLNAAPSEIERAKLMEEFVVDAGAIAAERRALLEQGLDETERLLKEPVEAHFNDMLAVNSALTAHLRAGAEVVATRDQLLAAISVNPRQIVPLDDVNGFVERLIETGTGTAMRAEEIRAKVNEILAQIRETIEGAQDGTIP